MGGFGFSAWLFKIEKIFKFLIQRDAEDQSQLSRRAEMPCFNGADGIAGYADPFGKLRLGESLFRSDCFQAVFQDELIVQRITALQSGRYGDQIINMAGRGQQYKQCNQNHMNEITAMPQFDVFDPCGGSIPGKRDCIEPPVDAFSGDDLDHKKERSQYPRRQRRIGVSLHIELMLEEVGVFVLLPAFRKDFFFFHGIPSEFLQSFVGISIIILTSTLVNSGWNPNTEKETNHGMIQP